jgi:peptide-methionine (S)-S-oxide reductase
VVRLLEAQLRRAGGVVLCDPRPDTRNRQGLDSGSQYRSAIFVHDAAKASALLAEHQKQLRKAIVTEIVPAETFWKADEYHQRYFEEQGRAACAVTLQR